MSSKTRWLRSSTTPKHHRITSINRPISTPAILVSTTGGNVSHCQSPSRVCLADGPVKHLDTFRSLGLGDNLDSWLALALEDNPSVCSSRRLPCEFSTCTSRLVETLCLAQMRPDNGCDFRPNNNCYSLAKLYAVVASWLLSGLLCTAVAVGTVGACR
ncbi:uncharacterized protein EURHEDRAFT_217160 [Aspergillus ruber CBS 135680]|uniref:Uncharacterized protein n=1 Tax=Aspergillus ruber (strain CBS 135680) TaxID=1388766 RepID=A0A017SQQ0_ASPRC|nr:uncharacterized protein EURHEDRAFT_217160 [Aspergillus ruber CBS 135680]EYE98565.1 hypothetical protein EURHEDRAFT_217160 [Aspergillus ruber CBS 135680]